MFVRPIVAALASAAVALSLVAPASAVTKTSGEFTDPQRFSSSVMVCSSDRPITWTVGKAPSVTKKSVRKTARKLRQYFNQIEAISGGRFTFRYVPDVPLVSAEKNDFAFSRGFVQPPKPVAADRDVDSIVVLARLGKVSVDDVFTVPRRGWGARSFPWDFDETRPDGMRSGPSPYVTAVTTDVTKKNSRPDNDTLLFAALHTVLLDDELQKPPSRITKKMKKNIRVAAQRACDPNVPRNYIVPGGLSLEP